jgi:iron complex transport system ATP-binding protein
MIFSVKDGHFGYTSTNILNNINFQVNDGEILAILGPNGVGKTTLLRATMGFLKWKPGATMINGTDIREMKTQDVWKKVAYVPQAKQSVFSYSVEEMVLFGRCPHVGTFNQPKATDMALVEQAIESVGIGYLKGKKINQISGGELQMVLIARALATEPEMLILDEPESNLDFKNQLIILDTIQHLSSERGISCVFNTHYPAHALKIAHKALILNKNGTVLFGKAKEVITKENMQTSFGVNVDIHDFEAENRVFKSVTAISLC